eukprot:4988353-Prorocentrum_lima.AAC.1
MTSSLVGSEMCIRDRAAEPQTVESARAPKHAERVLHLHCQRGRARGSVSYTHLTLPTICSV